MYTHSSKTRIRYGETDQMGYCYYGNYAQFFEIGRVECLRSLGLSYKALENDGVLLPVLDLNIKYIKPAFYDDLLTIETTIISIPNVRIKFNYKVFNENKELTTTGSTTLVFVAKDNMKPIPCPEKLLEAVMPFFKKDN